MRSPRSRRAAVLLAGALASLAVSALSLREGLLRRRVSLCAQRRAYLHYDIVVLRLNSRDAALDARWRARAPRLGAERAGRIVPTVGGVFFETAERVAPGVWTARWPVPWNAPAGEYFPVLAGAGLGSRLDTRPFRIERRVPRPLPPGFVAATLETADPLASFSVLGPDGRREDWRGLLDWAKALRADAVWMLGGQSPGERGSVWRAGNIVRLDEVARECRSRGLKFGVYAEYSLTASTDGERVGGYEYAREVQDGRPRLTRAISLRDPRRPADAAAFLKPFAEDPAVDFVGLDYIRNALGGDELVDDFAAEMPGLALPPEWPRLTRAERMVWLARKRVMRGDAAFLDAWNWWRARRAALIVREVRARLGAGKPLWVFTLTWDKGWQHGQDAAMMNDAGADVDALMFYQADRRQFAAMLKQWHSYLRRGDAQVAPGEIFDWDLHQRDPSGPAEFSRRLDAALARVYADGPAQAAFFHDLARLASGRRLGPWGARGWARAARGVADRLKSRAAAATEKRP